jgi:hypothetical protein
VLKKEETISVFNLARIKKPVDIGLVPQSLYKYDAHSDDTGSELVEDNNE